MQKNAIELTDPIERHIEGGTELGGLPSEPLLKSIFDVHTPGHDGAAKIRDGRVERFAVYLPLSKDLEKTAGRGTRHAAAIGLSERCDALAIVVSEETGKISIVVDGQIERGLTPDALRVRLRTLVMNKQTRMARAVRS